MSANFTPDQKGYKTYQSFGTFRLFVLENFPFIAEDFDALTYYQMLCKVVGYLKDVITNNESLQYNQTELLDAFNELQSYVNTYFDNLDLQTEINNKLDQMAQDGTLANLINQEIFSDLNNKIDLINSNNTICIGDSYGLGASGGGTVNGWPFLLKNFMNLSDDEFYNFSSGGAGFLNRGSENVTFLEKLQKEISNVTNKNLIKNIVVCGGHNDYSYNSSEIQAAMKTFAQYCHQQFPNANIYAGMIAGNMQISSLGNTRRNGIYGNVLYAYSSFAGITNRCYYLNGLENIMKNPKFMSEDFIHPNQLGYTHISWGVHNALKLGSYINILNDTIKNDLNFETLDNQKFIYKIRTNGNNTKLSFETQIFTPKESMNLSNATISFLKNIPYLDNFCTPIFMGLHNSVSNSWKNYYASLLANPDKHTMEIRIFDESNTQDFSNIDRFILYRGNINCITITNPLLNINDASN